MIEPDATRWPAATVDGVTAVEILAGATTGRPVLVRRVIDAPAARLWEWLTDLETSIPAFDRTVRSVMVHHRDGNRLTMSVRQRFLPALPFVCHIGTQHIIMSGPGRIYTVAYGLRALSPERSLFVQFEGAPGRVGRLAASLVARHVNHDADTVKQLGEQGVGLRPDD